VTIHIGRRMKVYVSRDDAEDIFQSALLRLLKKLGEGGAALAELQNDPEAARRYLHGILKNLVLEQARAHSRYTQRFVPADEPGGDAGAVQGGQERQQELQRLVDKLSARQLKILELKIDGFRQREIAERLQLSEPTVSREIGAIRNLYAGFEMENARMSGSCAGESP
jgi:RNA polymerase sigma factor (sigma-70 family)